MDRWLKKENITTLHMALARVAKKNPQKTALDFMGKKFSYAETLSMTRKFSCIFNAFAPMEPKRACVGLFMPNIPQFVFSYYGALSSYMVAVPINFSSIARELKTDKPKNIKITEEIVAQIKDSKPDIMVVADIFWPILEQAKEHLTDCTIIVTGIDDFLPFPLNKLYLVKNRLEGKNVKVPYAKDPFIGKVCKLKYLLSDCPEARMIKGFEDATAQLLYTGGTTGVPKGAMLTHKNVMTNVLQCREHIGDLIGPEQRVLGVLPFFHSYGLTAAMHMTLLALEGTLFLMPSFEAKKCLKLIQEKKITMFPAVNRMLQLVSELPDPKTPALELCISGAGPLDMSVKQKFEEATGSIIVEGYGLTESSPVVSVTLPNENKPGSCGRPLPLTEVRIVDTETGLSIAPGLEGEIIVRGPQVMKGYFKKPEATADMIRDGWLYTGDIGRIDSEGFIYITDRKKDMFTVGGENVFCKNIEDHFRAHSAVAKCAVIGVKNAKMGEAPVLFVVINAGHDVSEIYQHARVIPNKFWNPVDIVTVDEKQFLQWEDILGKLKRRKIREYYLEKQKNEGGTK